MGVSQLPTPRQLAIARGEQRDRNLIRDGGAQFKLTQQRVRRDRAYKSNHLRGELLSSEYQIKSSSGGTTFFGVPNQIIFGGGTKY